VPDAALPPSPAHARASSERGEAIFGLVVVLTAAATWLTLTQVRGLGAIDAPLHVPWYALVVGFALVEIFVIHLDRGPQTHTFSLLEIPLVVGLFLASPLQLIGARLLGAGLALAIHRRQAPAKLAFNLSMFALETAVAVVVFRALAGSHVSIDAASWPAAFAACIAENGVGVISVSLAIVVTNGRITASAMRRLLFEGVLLGPVANTSVALCVTVLLWFEPIGAVLMLFIAAVLVLAYRGYISLTERYANLTKLYEFNQRTQRGVDADEVVVTMLDAARSVTNAEIACLVMLAGDGSHAVEITVDKTGAATTQGPLPLAQVGQLWTRTLDSPSGLVVTANAMSELDRSMVRGREWRDCLSSNFRRDGEVRGLLAVANRVGHVASFDHEDLILFNALVSHAEVILDNSELVGRLQHEALHDALTSLPNRSLFNREVEAAIARRPAGEKVAVLLMDLDRFKDVNDTLGHHHGDQLLIEVGRRLLTSVPKGSTVARLGGDEFAVLLPMADEPEHFYEHANALGDILRHGFDVEDMQVEAAASIGIALCPDHGEDPMTLLQRADVAMYASKTSGVVEVYSPERDDNSRRRLGLVTELRAALTTGALEVWYQPQADAQTGAVGALEALVRWRHPTRGLIPPDEFIPVAEQTGLIGPLANYVIAAAAQQWQQWHATGLSVGISVNLSMRNLQDPSIADQVGRQLLENRMPTSVLIVEITESSIMADSARILQSLESLAAAGIGISVDDFGTGYSSFTHLRQLPVREIKVDKSFVMNMTRDAGDAAIVRSVIDLGRNLGLQVVAEGVESADAWRQLAAWGCHRIQGYHLSKPMPADAATAWLMDRPTKGPLGEWDAPVTGTRSSTPR
jgi:diguanylate cyclase (GGDEF)-like protein